MSPSRRTHHRAPARVAAQPRGRLPLEAVIATSELEHRPARAPDFESESRALVGLMRALRDADTDMLSLGHTVRTARAAPQGLAMVDEFRPEVVLLDIGLPGMDGYQLAGAIRARGIATRIVALTGYGQPDDVKRALASGIDAHLVKPADLDALQAALRPPPPRPGDRVVSFGRRQA